MCDVPFYIFFLFFVVLTEMFGWKSIDKLRINQINYDLRIYEWAWEKRFSSNL